MHLYVPAESVEAYKSAEVWKDFIIEAIPVQEPEWGPKEFNVEYQGPEGSVIGTETLTLNLPEPDKIDGYTFSKWEIVGGDLAEGIKIQAVYEENANLAVRDAASAMSASNVKAKKVIKGSNIYILKAGKTFDIQGRYTKR